jgi:YidC/Oxa1 family membrane protein insertase
VDLTPYPKINKMDFIKTALITAIAITLYYLLLQWPNEPVNLGDEEKLTQENQLIIESDDSLTNTLSPMDSPVVQVEKNTIAGPSFETGNKNLSLYVDALSGRIVGSQLKTFKESLGGENSLKLFGEVGGNLYLGNSGFYSMSQGYLQPNFSNLSSKIGTDGSLVFVLTGENDNLYHKRKMTFQESGYSVIVEDSITSALSSEVSLTPYVVIERNSVNEAKGGFMSPERFAYLGPVFSTSEDVYEKYDFGDINDAPFRKTSPGGWVALIQHYFLTAWVPDQTGTYKYQGQWGGGSNRYIIGYTAQNSVLAPGESVQSTNTLYVGPKYPGDLSKLQENLDLTVDYGFLFWLGKPMYWVLEKGDDLFNSWGMAIIFLTVIVKLLTWPLSAKSYTSMGKMRVIQPKMMALQERYGDDKQKLSQEMMELYRKEGVNPLGSCLPMFLQMPFFLAFYWVLLETVQLRHSSFLWLDDLSAMDPYFILPILNGLGMYLSQKMTPTPPSSDPMQANMLKFMPVMFAVLFAWFPAGLVLYWLMNMLIQIIQQWWYSRTSIAN